MAAPLQPPPSVAELLQRFEDPLLAKDGETYSVSLFGRSRPGDTWQGWLVFERQSDGRRFATGVETTQPDARAVLDWATGLGDAYFEGALRRAMEGHDPKPRPIPAPRPVVTRGTDTPRRAETLGLIEDLILDLFRLTDQTHLLTPDVLEAIPHAHADTVRAIEALEKRHRALVRRTEQGNDWLFLTVHGMELAGLEERPHAIDHST